MFSCFCMLYNSNQLHKIVSTIFSVLQLGKNKCHHQDGCSCQSPVHVNHLFMSITCSCQSPVHVNHLFMSITCSCQSPVHANHLFMSITCSCQSPVHVNHPLPSPTNTAHVPSVLFTQSHLSPSVCCKPMSKVTVTEIKAREKCGLLAVPHTVPGSRDVIPICCALSVLVYSRFKHVPHCDCTCKVLGNPKDNCDVSASVFVVQFNGFMSLGGRRVVNTTQLIRKRCIF